MARKVFFSFKYDDVEYVLDPCLNLLCKKDDSSNKRLIL